MIRLDCNVSVAHYPLSRDYRLSCNRYSSQSHIDVSSIWANKKYYCLLFNFNYHTETLIYSLILCTLMTGSRVHIPYLTPFYILSITIIIYSKNNEMNMKYLY